MKLATGLNAGTGNITAAPNPYIGGHKLEST